MLLHGQHGGNQPVVVDAHALVETDALVAVAVPHLIVKKRFGDRPGQILSVVVRDQMKHQVERRRAARAGDATPVDLVEAVRDLDVGKALPEAWECPPSGPYSDGRTARLARASSQLPVSKAPITAPRRPRSRSQAKVRASW